MTKERRTLSLEPHVDEYLGQDGRNASEYVERLVKLDMGEEAFNEELIRMRMEMEKEAYEDKASAASRHLRRYNQLKSRLEEAQERKEERQQQQIEGAIKQLKPSSWLQSIPKEDQIPGPNSEEVQDLSEDMDLTAEELHDKVVTAVLEESE